MEYDDYRIFYIREARHSLKTRVQNLSNHFSEDEFNIVGSNSNMWRRLNQSRAQVRQEIV